MFIALLCKKSKVRVLANMMLLGVRDSSYFSFLILLQYVVLFSWSNMAAQNQPSHPHSSQQRGGRAKGRTISLKNTSVYKPLARTQVYSHIELSGQMGKCLFWTAICPAKRNLRKANNY